MAYMLVQPLHRRGGLMGSRGPIPRRSDQRRRQNKAEPVTTGQARSSEMPEPDESWHEIARDWYLSLGSSGQSDFYEPSDWAYAQVWAEILSRQLASGRPSAQMLTAWQSASAGLLTTEGERRRHRLELKRGFDEASADGVDDELEAHRQRREKTTGGDAS